MTIHKPDDYWNWDYRPVLPQTLTIQLKAQKTDTDLSNIYCHYWISVGADDCFTEHIIRTDSEGKIVRTRKQLIDNMKRLGADYDEKNPLDDFPIRFDFKVWSSKKMFHEVKNMERDISGFLVDEMKQHFNKYPLGFPEETQKEMIKDIEANVEKLKIYFPDIKQNGNQILNISEDQSEITDTWTEEREHLFFCMLTVLTVLVLIL